MNARRDLHRRADAPHPRRVRGESGAVAVEFALILPILAMLLLGTVTAGMTYAHGVGLSNAVREGSRFGATTGISPSPATPALWNSAVIARVRATQFDGSANGTAICARLWKGTAAAGAVVTGTSGCDQGTFGSPALSTADAAFPAVPAAGLTADSCVVQVLAAQKYSITLGVIPSLNGTMKRGAVARYERACS